MERVDNEDLIKYYMDKYNIVDFFDDNIYEHIELHRFNKNELVLRSDDKLMYYYLFVKGKIKVTYQFENGRSILLKFYDEFNSLGNLELLNEIPIRCNVEAIEDSELIAVSAELLRKDYIDNPKFLRHIINSLSEKMYATMNNTSYNVMYPLVNRLASYLIEYISEDKDYIVLTSSYKEISEFLGSTYRHLSRTFKQMEKDKIITLDKKRVYILDEEKLRSLSKNIYRLKENI